MKAIVKIVIVLIVGFTVMGLFNKETEPIAGKGSQAIQKNQDIQDIKIETQAQLWEALEGVWVDEKNVYFYFYTNENNENILSAGIVDGDKTLYEVESLFFSTNTAVELLLHFIPTDGTTSELWKNTRLDISDYKNGSIMATLPFNGDDDDVKAPQSAEYKTYRYTPTPIN